MNHTRREFIARAGQAGALVALTPTLPRHLLAAPEARPFGALAAADARLDGLRWRLLGPFRGGRVDAVSGVIGRPNEFYFGAVNGGVWKSIDAGRVWEPIFDDQPVASIGAIAVSESDPDVVYVGTGESTLRDSAGFGNGVYKSTDAGKTWTHLGLAGTQHIGKIAIDPRNPDIVFVAAIGSLYAANEERGVFRSTDGGRSWQKVLYKNADVGAVEVVIDPSDSEVVYAGLWNTRRPPWFVYAPTNGPGGGLYKSTDGGSTWKPMTNGLPASDIGRTGIAVAPSEPSRLYAVVDCLLPDPGADASSGGGRRQAPKQGGVYRSDDAGASWRRLSNDPALWGRGWYFEKIAVDPQDADIVYVPNVAFNRTLDGGKTWDVIRGSPGGDDYHQIWISPADPNTIVIASDQGCVITHNARDADPMAITYTSWLNQPTAQLYHIAIDYRFPYWVTGAQQDSGAVAVRSRGKFAEISMRDWEPVGAGGESGYTCGDPLHPGIIFGGTGERWDIAQNRQIPDTTTPTSADAPARTDWTQPLVRSEADQRAMYYASQFLFKSTDGAKSWTQISPDLTRENPGIPSNLDEAARNNVGNDRRGVIYTIAPSPIHTKTLWIGTDDGYIQLTRDDGGSWQNVTPAALTAWSRVTMMEASHFDVDTAYASVDRHQLQDFDPYIYRTRDQGKTWQQITTGLPAGAYVHVVKEDPVRRGLLFAGTERGVFVSFDDGDRWQPLQLNLPASSMRDFQIYGNDLIVGSFGRGIWVMDDISPLRQLSDAILASEAHLFKPADAINYDQGGDNATPLPKDEPQAQNPGNDDPWTGSRGPAFIYYYLREDATGPVNLEVLDASGEVVATFGEPADRPAGRQPSGLPRTSPQWRVPAEPFGTRAGLHRVVWSPVIPGRRGGDGEAGTEARLLTGAFTARLRVGGTTYEQPFTVKPDPRELSGY
ncbi:MAG: glycosyl hydrolase [Rhodothermales bacterium]